jgi:ribosomal protein S18 acetylase RimI-like enzyme
LEFIIRRCHIGDETSLSLLGKSTFLETYAGSTQADDLLSFVETEHSVERYRSWLESRFARLWVAEIGWGRSAIGYAVTLVSPDTGLSLEMEIKRLYVLHRFQQRSLGRRLMNRILATAREDGIDELFLRVQKLNENAPNFYSRHGFRVAGEETFRVGARDYPALVMRLALGTPTRAIRPSSKSMGMVSAGRLSVFTGGASEKRTV